VAEASGCAAQLGSWSTSSHEHEDDLDANGLAARLQRYLDDTQHERADVDVCAIPTPDDMLNLLEQSGHIDQLGIVGRSDQKLIKNLTGSSARKVLRKTDCSLLTDD
jgi:hypothetical protein